MQESNFRFVGPGYEIGSHFLIKEGHWALLFSVWEVGMVPRLLLPDLGEMGQELFLLLLWPSPGGQQSSVRSPLVAAPWNPKGIYCFTTSSLEVGALTFALAAQWQYQGSGLVLSFHSAIPGVSDFSPSAQGFRVTANVTQTQEAVGVTRVERDLLNLLFWACIWEQKSQQLCSGLLSLFFFGLCQKKLKKYQYLTKGHGLAMPGSDQSVFTP